MLPLRPLALLLAAVVAPAQAQELPPAEAALRAHVRFLASDAMKGREAGTPEYDIAAHYVAAQMAAAGLVPGGEGGGWLQPVPLFAARLAGTPTVTLTTADGAATPLAFGTDFTLRQVPTAAAIDVAGPVVFVGYGVVDPASGRDDYKGLDVRGKIVAMLYSGPKGLNSEVAAHLGNGIDRARVARDHGAVGVLRLVTSQIEGVYPFARMAADADARAVTWANPDGSPRDPGAPSLGVVSFAGAARLFAGYRASWAAIRAADDAGRPLPTGTLPVRLAAHARFTVEHLASSNVVGRLAGSDPTLKDEVVVLSAHLDHIGVGKPVNGDAINNGAMDNAMGVALMLEAAKAFGAGPRPKRSLLFLAVTAEEKGLIGSDYYATHPTVPAANLVADVNLDMPILTYRFQDLVAFGADRSGIGPVVAAAAKARGYALSPDPAPEEADFVRTDHYSFVRRGVPSVSLTPGWAGPGKAAQEEFLAKHYHRPSDDLSLPIDWTAGRAFVDLNVAVARALADAPDRPRWVKGDYFGTAFKGPMAN